MNRAELAVDLVPDAADPNTNSAAIDVYTEPNIRKHAERVVELTDGQRYGGLLAVRIDDMRVSFIVFRFNSGPGTKTNGEVVSPPMYERVFHGVGFSGSLRECRHTYWGDGGAGGYIYYVPAWLIRAAFDALGEWFDLD